MTRAVMAVWVLAFSSVGWGLTWWPIKSLNSMGLPTLDIVFVAFLAISIVLLPFLYWQRKQWLPVFPMMLLIGVVGGIANFAFQTAISEGNVIRVMILFYMLPIWSALGGWLFLKERIDQRRFMALCLCVLGAFSILEVWEVSWQAISLVDVLAFVAGIALSANNILFRFTANVPLVSKVGFVAVGCLVILLFVFVFFGLSFSTPSILFSNEFAWGELWQNNNSSTLDVISLSALYGVAGVLLITLGSQWGVTQLEAGRSAVIIVLELVTAIVSVMIITQVSLQIHEVIGGLMVLVAALLEGVRNEPTIKGT